MATPVTPLSGWERYPLRHPSRGGDPSHDLVRDHHLRMLVGAWLVVTLWTIA